MRTRSPVPGVHAERVCSRVGRVEAATDPEPRRERHRKDTKRDFSPLPHRDCAHAPPRRRRQPHTRRPRGVERQSRRNDPPRSPAPAQSVERRRSDRVRTQNHRRRARGPRRRPEPIHHDIDEADRRRRRRADVLGPPRGDADKTPSTRPTRSRTASAPSQRTGSRRVPPATRGARGTARCGLRDRRATRRVDPAARRAEKGQWPVRDRRRASKAAPTRRA